VEAIFRDQQPRLAVVIPSFHNPLGVTITLEKRQELAALSARYQVPLIEDDPYSSLRFEGDPVPPIKAFDEAGTVFYLGSFSKMLAPAVRLGWVVAPAELIPRITVIRESLDLETSTLTQRGVYDFLSRGYLEPHLEELNAANRVRRDAMMTALERELGEIASWTRPQGGLFVWVTLPETVDTWEMFEEAVQTHQVAYIPGSAFNVYDRGRNTMRLNFSNASPELIQQGIHRLATVIRSRLD
jgi:2-aminoadipate transaminase